MLLPEDIRVFRCLRVAKSFAAYHYCSERRYEYILPTYCFQSRYEIVVWYFEFGGMVL